VTRLDLKALLTGVLVPIAASVAIALSLALQLLVRRGMQPRFTPDA
jgi:hypothetical protein